MAATKRAPRPSLDFDENTPPPRRDWRPGGTDPIPAWVELPLNEPIAALFLDWAAGRVPAGSVLCEFVGTFLGMNRHSGYQVAAVSDEPAVRSLGKVGATIPAAALDPYRVAVVVKEQAKPAARFVVMAPLPAGGR